MTVPRYTLGLQIINASNVVAKSAMCAKMLKKVCKIFFVIDVAPKSGLLAKHECF